MNAAQNLPAEETTEDATLRAIAIQEEPAEPKHQRRQTVQINVRYDERELDPLTQMKLHTLRREIHALNKSLRERNGTITRLRGEVRLRDRVMRLKQEAAREAVTRAIDTALKTADSGRSALDLQRYGG